MTLALLSSLTLLAAPRQASAQVSAERFQPAPGPRNFLMVETARTAGDMAFSLGLTTSYAYDPFRLLHCLPGPCAADGAMVDKIPVVQSLFTANLLASFTPLPRLQIGLRLPVAYASGEGVDTDPATAGYGDAQPGGVAGFAMGDPALEVKVRVFGRPESALAAGISASLSAPVGHATAPSLYVGDASPVGVLRAILDADFGRFFLAANAGAALRATQQIGTLSLGPEARAGLGAGVRAGAQVRFIVEGSGSTNFTTSAGTNGAEVDLAAQYAPAAGPVLVTLGGGAGLNDGLGVPLFRVIAGVGVNVERGAREAAAKADRDHDGIPDAEDMCPDEGGDVVRVRGKHYGCPKRDADGDGVPDHLDACPDVPGIATQDPLTNGCPDPDRDHDGIPNDKDKCPDEPETYNGFQDADGCPDVAPVKVEVRSDQIVIINETVQFEPGSDRIVGARSFEALDLVASALNAHPDIKRMEIAGHTDNVGLRETNVALSRKRAAAVVAYLKSKGVDAGRLVSNGYGPDKPLAPNDTELGRAQNRRVQFNVLMMFK